MNSRDIYFYLRGVMNIASSVSKNIGPSYIEVECYDKSEFEEEFKRNYKINIKLEELEKLNNSLEDALKIWFYNEKSLIDSINYLFRLHLPEIKNIYYITEELINEIRNKKVNSIFYDIEDFIFIELEDKIIIFILGNNE